jgi:competence ComEA-like helix-hairpin-helix protein
MQPDKKHPFKRYLTFSASERSAIGILLILSFILFLLPHIYPNLVKPSAERIENEGKKNNAVPNDFADNKSQHALPHTNEKADQPSRLFHFDPNTASIEDWKLLGLPEKTAATIIRYRMKGGRFKDPEDIKKIWGLTAEMANRLMPFVRIEAPVWHNKNEETGSVVIKKRIENVVLLDINTANQEAWESLKGVGPTLAGRIIKFRDKLGGFISVQQVGETYGLPDSTFQKISPLLVNGAYKVHQVNINLSTIEQLSKHPYINFRTAKALVNYRDQNGFFQDIQDVKKIESISEDIFLKIEKYLTIE